MVASTLVALLIGVGIGAATKKDKTTNVSASAVTTTTAVKAPAVTPAPTTKAAPSTTVAPTTTTTAARTQQEVVTAGGTANKRTDTFHLTGSHTTLAYDFPQNGAFVVYVVPAGHSVEKDGGFPEVDCFDPCKDTTQLAQSAGDYYLDVRASAPWSVTVTELR